MSVLLNKLLVWCSAASIGTLSYYWLYDGEYYTIFLPFTEGLITIVIIAVLFAYRRAKSALLQNRYTFVPLIFASLALCITALVFAISGGSSLDELLSVPLLLTGGIGIPLGMVIGFLWPFIASLNPVFVYVIFSITPLFVALKELRVMGDIVRSNVPTKYVVVNCILPVTVLVLCLPTVGILSAVQEEREGNRQVTHQNNHMSYEIGKQVQHAIENFRTNNERFPSTLDELVETNMLPSIPVSPVDARPYTYTKNGDNYLICFPQTDKDRCEDSWSR